MMCWFFYPTGNFGGGVQSFFLFMRFLVVLNFVTSLLILGLILVPSIIFRSVGSNLVNSTGNNSTPNVSFGANVSGTADSTLCSGNSPYPRVNVIARRCVIHTGGTLTV